MTNDVDASKKISSGMDGFACGAMGPPESLESYRLISFK